MADLVIKTTIETPTLSGADWDLFVGDGSSMDKRCDRAAFRINEKFALAVNAGWDRETTETAVLDTMVQFSDTGATDSEPLAVLQGLLDRVYGRQ